MKLTVIFLFCSFALFAQNIQGVVVDRETKQALEYVNIFFKSDQLGAVTNENGEFNFEIKKRWAENDSLIFSSIGYDSREYTFSTLKENNFRVELSRNVVDLHELTVSFKRELKAKMKFTKLAPMEEAVYAFGSVLVDGKIYVQGGDASYIEETAKKILDDVSSNPESSFADFIKKSRRNFSREKYSAKLQIYDILKKSWTSSALVFRERAYHNMVYDNNQLYIFGGKGLSETGKYEFLDEKLEILYFNMQNIKSGNSNPHQAVNFQSFVYNHRLIVMGGSVKLRKDGNKVFSNEVHQLDLKLGKWSELKAMPEAKETKGVLIDNTIYLIGGYANKVLSKIESFNLSTGEWKKEGTLFHGIARPALTVYKKVIYIFSDGKIISYNTADKILNEYHIDLNLKEAELYYFNNKLYIVGGYTEVDFIKEASPNLYSIDITEFYKTKVVESKKF